MIKGMGIDLIEIERMKISIEKFQTNFLNKIFTNAEQKEASKRQDFITYYAGRWAVKESISKALGCGIGKKCGWLDIEILNAETGKPQAKLIGTAEKTFKELGATILHVSLSHEGKNAIAMAIIE